MIPHHGENRRPEAIEATRAARHGVEKMDGIGTKPLPCEPIATRLSKHMRLSHGSQMRGAARMPAGE